MSHAIGVILLAVVCVVAPVASVAEVIDIGCREVVRLEHRVTEAPGSITEVCGRLAHADEVAWRFDASGPLDFNIHYHEGQDVRYAARQDATAAADGKLLVALGQDHCWMWTNKSDGHVSLALALERRVPGR